jgi:hypothetical protein
MHDFQVVDNGEHALYVKLQNGLGIQIGSTWPRRGIYEDGLILTCGHLDT